MSKILSILIPTLPSRIEKYLSLVNKINHQITSNNLNEYVQVLSILDTKEMTVGEKRNNLVNLSCGKYVIFLDDDDNISDNYVLQIYNGCLSGADVVTFKGEYHENNSYHSDFIISNMVIRDYNQHGLMYRKPNHICAVLRSISIQCPFPHINYEEDSKYSELINAHIKNECHINEKLYFYMFDKKTSETHIF